MNDKIICPNCGAHLLEEDKVCYVCGQVVENPPRHSEPEKAEIPNENPTSNSSYSVQEDYDYEDEQAYPYGEDDRQGEDKRKMSRAKKTGIVCGICIAVAVVIAAVVCVCFANGLFAPHEEKEEYTIYFDKPSSDINLIDSDGTVYNWGGDVEVLYTLDGYSTVYENPCKMASEYDNLWECKIPAQAKNVCFSPSTTDNIRTNTLPGLKDEYVYYVTDILLDGDLQMPVGGCPLEEFFEMGINYVQPTEQITSAATETPAESSAAETAEATQPSTEETLPDDSDPYSITIPASWSSGTTVIVKGNCTTYYETYNYKNYQMGNLLSIYVVDASDTSFSDMNNVKKVKKTSDGKKKIVIVTPTDIQFNDADDVATENYINLSNLTNQVISSIEPN